MLLSEQFASNGRRYTAIRSIEKYIKSDAVAVWNNIYNIYFSFFLIYNWTDVSHLVLLFFFVDYDNFFIRLNFVFFQRFTIFKLRYPNYMRMVLKLLLKLSISVAFKPLFFRCCFKLKLIISMWNEWLGKTGAKD